jgi:hypothetical protein
MDTVVGEAGGEPVRYDNESTAGGAGRITKGDTDNGVTE